MGYRAESPFIDDYSYLPATFLFHLPSYLLFRDVRYSYLTSDLLVVWFLLKLSGYDFSSLFRSFSFLSHTPIPLYIPLPN